MPPSKGSHVHALTSRVGSSRGRTPEHFHKSSATPKLRNALAFVDIFPSVAIGTRTEMVRLLFVKHLCVAHYDDISGAASCTRPTKSTNHLTASSPYPRPSKRPIWR